MRLKLPDVEAVASGGVRQESKSWRISSDTPYSRRAGLPTGNADAPGTAPGGLTFFETLTTLAGYIVG